MVKSENCPPRIAIRSNSARSIPRLALRTAPKLKLLEATKSSAGNINRTPMSGGQSSRHRLMPVKFVGSRPKLSRPSVLPNDPEPPFEKQQEVRETDDLGIEKRIRSALTTESHHAGSSRRQNTKSVKWDPAIIAYGPDRDINHSMSELLRLSHTHESSSRAFTENVHFEDIVNSVAQWGVDGRLQLQRLLEEWKQPEIEETEIEEPLADTGCPAEGMNQKPLNSNSVKAKGLDPRAPSFRDYSSLRIPASPRTRIQQRFSTWSIPRSRSRARQCIPDTAFQPPVWVNTFASSPVPDASGVSVTNHNPSSHFGSSFLIPSEDGPGRIALAIHPLWAEAVLSRFVVRYPLTGKREGPSVAANVRHATTIQQRLEFRLLQEKERRIWRNIFGMDG